MITVVAINPAEAWRAATGAELAQVMPEMFGTVLAILRDLDFVGSFGNAELSIPFVILPMTEQPGADVVRHRLADKLSSRTYPVDGAAASLRVAVSATAYDKTKAPDLKAFVQLVRQRHAAEEAAVSAGQLNGTSG
jgi:hypothetical protein